MSGPVGETDVAAGAAPEDDAAQRERRAQAHALLLAWYARDGRATLPWRHTRDPYAVLVSEMMLQQTQVERVLPKYQAFLARFPTLSALAAAPTSEVIKEWAGLGYNLRAVRLHGIAQQAMERGGALPDTLDGLLSLKGIGRYTAGAVACFGLGLPVATVDTNIRRVLWRVFQGIEPATWPTGEPATRAILTLAEWALPDTAVSEADAPSDTEATAAVAERAEIQPADTDAGESPHRRAALVYDWQQALMDLGALVCQSRRPACERCPLTTVCVAYAEVAQVALFPSGEALARLRDERAEVARHGWDTPATWGGPSHGAAEASAPTHEGRVAETRAGYTTAANDGAPATTGRRQPAQRRRGSTSSRQQAPQPFSTTSRYFRGRIVDALRALPAGETFTLSALGPQIKADFAPDEFPWLRGLVDGLARDGLARIVDAEQGDADVRVALP
ncbi:MAG TPA: hypothetical protein VMV29_10195 [Ktedonobacterales bacterium]|nr:hypothetical protein [Ktedonobacterales bacterium]